MTKEPFGVSFLIHQGTLLVKKKEIRKQKYPIKLNKLELI